MKLLLVIAACVVATLAKPTDVTEKFDLVQLDKEELKSQLHVYNIIFPLKEFVALVNKYRKEDTEFLHHWQYMNTSDFKDSFTAMQMAPEFKTFLDFLEVSGIDAYNWANAINQILGVPDVQRESEESEESEEETTHLQKREIKKGMKGFVEDVKAIMRYDVFRAVHQKKLVNSGVYAVFMNRMVSLQFGVIVNDWLTSENYVKMLRVAVDNDIDVLAVRDLINALLAIPDRDRPHP